MTSSAYSPMDLRTYLLTYEVHGNVAVKYDPHRRLYIIICLFYFPIWEHFC